MIDQEKLKDVLVKYKRDFVEKQWPAERYKWEAVKHFQENWKIDAPDFAAMFKLSLAKTINLLASSKYYPAQMMHNFAQKAPEEVRAMFIDLFDESKDVFERINTFKLKSEIMLDKHGDGAKQHYQNENSISTYLWLRFPDKYYIYKFSEIKEIVSVLGCDYDFKKGAYADNIRNFLKLYDEICAELQQDEELINLLKSQLTANCYPDLDLRTLTIDVGFYISRNFAQNSDIPTEEWWPTDYSPGLSVEDWVGLLQDNEVFNADSLEIMRSMKDYGGKATCKELSSKYGESVNFYKNGSSSLAKRVAEKTNCSVMEGEEDNLKWWPILYVGKKADASTEGFYTWKLRDELAKALNKIDLSKIKVRVSTPLNKEERGYWWLNANPKIWSISDLAVGKTQSYTLYNDNGNKRRIFQNFIDAKAGDLVVGYESHPVKKIVSLAKVSKASDGENLYFEKTEGLVSPIDYATLRNAPELSQMEYFVNPQGSLFKLKKEEYEFIVDLIREQNPIIGRGFREAYSKTDFLKDVFMTEERFSVLLSLLMNKQNLILQGAPGVGKTFAARRLAYAAMGEKDDNRIELIQFHQNYSYEDFIMGYKPKDTGFELHNGIFFSFCQKAMNMPDKQFFLIIDEINRGNMSKIFGELLMLIEKDYRGTKATLAYNGMPFTVPKNLFIIGTMNTADRSIAIIDYALRRRFSFFEMEPGFDSEGFKEYQKNFGNETFNSLIQCIKELNNEISADSSLGKGFCIGHSYFCNREVCTDGWMSEVVEYDILPTLSECWFDEPEKLQRWGDRLRRVLNG